MQLLFSARETIATLVKYKCKTFITLTPGLKSSGPIVFRSDSTIQWINHHPIDKWY